MLTIDVYSAHSANQASIVTGSGAACGSPTTTSAARIAPAQAMTRSRRSE